MKKIYYITDQNIDYRKSIYSAINSEVGFIQLRDKKKTDTELLAIVSEFLPLAKKRNIPFIINDRLDLALISDADGVHVGQSDIAPDKIMKIAKKYKENFICGVSTHSVEQAIEAERKGATYIAIGPVWSTPTKPTYKPVGLNIVREVVKGMKSPKCVAIGGINKDNVQSVLDTGVNMVAVVRANLWGLTP